VVIIFKYRHITCNKRVALQHMVFVNQTGWSFESSKTRCDYKGSSWLVGIEMGVTINVIKILLHKPF
jgi:hypothetical protein